MSIRNTLGNTVSSFKDTLASILGKTKTSISSIVGTTSTGITELFSGGFVGMDEAGMDELYIALKQYIDELEELIESVSYYENVDLAYKGKIQETVIEYLESVKKLFRAYITNLNQEIDEAKEAYNNFIASSQRISSNTLEDAEELRDVSKNIKL